MNLKPLAIAGIAAGAIAGAVVMHGNKGHEQPNGLEPANVTAERKALAEWAEEMAKQNAATSRDGWR